MPEKPKTYGKKIFSFSNAKKVHYDVYLRKPNKLHYGESCAGLCFDPEEEDPHILINPKQSDKAMINTCIHEVCHAFFWDKSEYEVSCVANTVSRLIFDMGWRKVEDVKSTSKTQEKRRVKKNKK